MTGASLRYQLTWKSTRLGFIFISYLVPVYYEYFSTNQKKLILPSNSNTCLSCKLLFDDNLGHLFFDCPVFFHLRQFLKVNEMINNCRSIDSNNFRKAILSYILDGNVSSNIKSLLSKHWIITYGFLSSIFTLRNQYVTFSTRFSPPWPSY